MAKFRSAKSPQKFASIHSSVQNHFNQEDFDTAATTSNSTAPPPWQSGVNLRLEIYRLRLVLTSLLSSDSAHATADLFGYALLVSRKLAIESSIASIHGVWWIGAWVPVHGDLWD